MTDFEIQYAAHTATCTFLLDSEGICRRIVMVPNANATRTREASRAAARCVGAQYVASLDASLAGMLSDMPKVGTSMLFARTDERGRISLVRTGHVTRFERHVEDPFIEQERPSVVATSAPPISPSIMPTQRMPRTTIPPDPYEAGHLDDRTMPVRPSDVRALRPSATDPEPPTMRTPFVGPPPARSPGEHVPRTRSEVVPRPNATLEPVRPLIRRRAGA
ncbi:MAG: hypothetical protein KIT84_42265 [Labilithrix sp.]|nr:hypothetical protein [Labilithrix sp.]MCW5817701.1 hypothetical protein [Labilithrix sp.]